MVIRFWIAGHIHRADLGRQARQGCGRPTGDDIQRLDSGAGVHVTVSNTANPHTTHGVDVGVIGQRQQDFVCSARNHGILILNRYLVIETAPVLLVTLFTSMLASEVT